MKTNLFNNITIRLSLYVVVFLLLLLGRGLGGGCLFAQTGVTLSNYRAQAGPAGSSTLTIDIRWMPPADPAKVWSDTVWVFADYNNAGTMTRLPLAKGATLNNPSWSGASVVEEPGNHSGVWLVGNARSTGTFSATLQMVATCRDTRPCVPTGVCVYAINYPPVGRYTAYNQIHFTGTPPFYVTYNDGGATVVQNGYAKPFSTPAGKTIVSFTDASLAPGTFICKPPVVQTLTASAQGYCMGSSGVTLSLSGTESGAVYQLYKDNTLQTGITLTGTGSAMPFPGSFGKGAYSVRTVAGAFCGAPMDGAPVLIEHPLPGNPTVTGGVRCGTGTVQLSASSPDAVIDWYDASAGGTLLPGGTAVSPFTTPSLTATKAFYAEARNATTGCVSSSRTAATATVNSRPTIYRVEDGSTCGRGRVQLRAISLGGTVDWYGGAFGGTVLPNGTGVNTFTTLSLVMTTMFYAEARDIVTGCKSSYRTPVTAAVQQHPAGSTVEFPEFNPCMGGVTPGATAATWTLIDRRESRNVQSYKVRLMHDGHLWMVQDLKFGDKCNKTTFRGSDGSDQTGSKLTSIPGYLYGDCRNNPQPGAGYLYDWAAAIQKAGAYWGNTSDVGCSGTSSGTSGTNPGACRGICPDGWHIPTGGYSGEFQALVNTRFRDCPYSNDDCWDAASPWEGVYGKQCRADGTIDNNYSGGNYWSASYCDNLGAYSVMFESNFAMQPRNPFKNRGLSVRCVRNY
jgi:uncharacterized protein (TIGR02145 family)